MTHIRRNQPVSHCAVLVPLISLTHAKIVPTLNVPLHGPFFEEFDTLCFVDFNSVSFRIRTAKIVKCFNRTKLCSLLGLCYLDSF